MNNLTTRKIVLGLLMALVLAFSVQGTADALNGTSDTIGVTATRAGTDISPVNLNWLNINDTITVPTVNPDNTSYRESIRVRVSSNANFPDPDSNTGATTTDQTWTEDDVNGNLSPSFGALTITVRSAGIVTVTVEWTSSDATSSSRNKSQKFTLYAVKSGLAVNFSDTVSLLSADNGVGAGVYNNEGHVKIHSGDGKNNPVTYTHTVGTLYIRYSNLYRNSDGTYIQSVAADTDLTTSSSADVWLAMGDDSSTVTAKVTNGTATNTRVYIHGRPTLKITTPTPPSPLEGDPGEVTTSDAIVVTVNDQLTTGLDGGEVANVPVKFEVADKTDTGGFLIPASTADTDNPDLSSNIVDVNNNPIRTADVPASAKTLYVRTTDSMTPSERTASVGFQFGTIPGTSEVTVSVSGKNISLSEKVKVQTGGVIAQLSISSNTRRSGNSNLFDLVASVTQNDAPLRGAKVTFHTGSGLLTRTPTGDTGLFTPEVADTDSLLVNSDANNANGPLTGRQVVEITDRSGLAQVTYNLGDNTGRQEIDASIYDMDDTATTDINESTLRQEITFVVNGPADPGRGAPDPSGTPTNRLAISPTSITGDPGDTETVTVTALDTANVAVTGVPVVLSLPSDFTTAGGSASLTSGSTPFTSTLTLPDEAGTHVITATAGGYSSASTTVTVTEPAAPGTLSITALGAPVNLQQTVEVTATNAAGTPVEGVDVTLSGPLFITRIVTTLSTGSIRAVVTIPSATGQHTLTASATGYNSAQVILSATGAVTPPTTTPGTPTPTPTGPAGVADSIEIDGSRQLSATVNRNTPLRVRVVDANDNGVSNVRVTFQVLAPGRGRLSQRGNGRAIAINTDRNGYANATLTPLGGNLIVEARAAGVTARVTFIITVGEAADTQPREPDAVPSREISPVVHVGAAQRPPMLWVDNGKIYALVGANVEEFGSGVEGAMNIAVGGGKVYWTEKTGDSAGTINSANLNGSNVQELASILAVPMGIAVDAANSKLYWTNSRGRIQSANLDGSKIQNVIPGGLEGVMDLTLAGGNAYWTQGGNVRFVNLSGQKQIRNISTGADPAGGLVIGGGKVYWTEMTGESAGTINSANLNGSGATQLASILAVPMGIAVDTSRSKLFWTNARGRIQRANLDGSKITNVVSDLGNPGDMVLSNSIAAPTQTPTTPTDTPPTASKSKYDVNGDGKVDNMDAGLVSDALNTTNAKYDVNDDGVVNFLDLLLVFDNRDADAAGAPTILGMQLSAAQIDVLKEQIDLLIATGDRSPAAMRTLLYLQQLIATARPEKTQLLANYPNPFNPETWIPYELATDTNVKITIYNTQGVVIRTLELGHQRTGYYTGRDRAAYWDGRNAFGEQVASGIYFYQFETDAMSSMRKMVILK